MCFVDGEIPKSGHERCSLRSDDGEDSNAAIDRDVVVDAYRDQVERKRTRSWRLGGGDSPAVPGVRRPSTYSEVVVYLVNKNSVVPVAAETSSSRPILCRSMRIDFLSAGGEGLALIIAIRRNGVMFAQPFLMRCRQEVSPCRSLVPEPEVVSACEALEA